MKKMIGRSSSLRLAKVLTLTVMLLMLGEGWWPTLTARAVSGANAPLFGNPTSYGVGTFPTAVATGDFLGKGRADLVTANSSAKTVSVLLNNGQGGFGATNTFALGAGTNAVAIAVDDFNGDGKPDIAVLDNSGDSHVDILLNSSSSVISFISPVSYSSGASTTALVVADIDGDGKPDIAALGNGQVTILLGQGDGTFQVTTPFAVSSGAKAIAAGDIDGDGKIDLVVTGNNSSFQTLNNYSSVGNPAFGIGSIGTGSSDNLALGDFNGDGKLDVVTVSSGSQSLNVWLNTSSRSHSIGFNQAAGSPITSSVTTPLALAIADFNRDGKSDIAVAQSGGTQVSILLNDGTGRFTEDSHSPYNVSGGISGLVTEDFNGDGAPDLAVSDTSGPAVEVAFNNDSRSFLNFSPAPTFTVSGNASHEAVGDFNGDGKLDAAVIGDTAGQYLTVLLGKGDGTFQNPLYPNTGGGGALYDVAVGDFNGDGHLDITLAQFNAGVVLILVGNGDGTFQTPVAIPTGSKPYALAVGDLNKDGKADIVTANYDSNNVTVLLNTTITQATPSFNFTNINIGNYDDGVAIGDFNHDGAPDLAISNGGASNTVSILLNDGSANFVAQPSLTIPAAMVYGVSAADFNGDGYADIVAVDYTGNQVGVFLSNGSNGTFQSRQLYPVGTNPTTVITADFNGDGIPDIATSNYGSQSISILLGDGDGIFRPAQNINTGPIFGYSSPFAVAAGDFDGDGVPDIAALTATSIGAVFLNDTAVDFEGFAPLAPLATGAKPVGVAVGDIDGDGKPDIVTVNDGDDSVTIALGNGQGGFGQPMRVKLAGKIGPKLSAGLNPSGVGLGDISGSGKQDIVVSDKGDGVNPGAVLILLNTSKPGAVSFDAPKTFQVGVGPNGVGLGDIDRTGRSGIVTPNGGDDSVSVLHNVSTPGTISFMAAANITLPKGSNPTGVGLGDISGSGKQDIVVSNKGSNSVSILLNNGTSSPTSLGKNLKPASVSSFAPAVNIGVGLNPTGVGLGDIDRTGSVDIVTANTGDNTISILSNISTSGSPNSVSSTNRPNSLSFAPAITVSVGSQPTGVGLGDISGSGKQSIVVSNRGSSNVTILRETDGLHFATPITVGVGISPDGVGLGDITGSGKLSIVTSNFGSDNVSVIEPKPAQPNRFSFAAPAIAGANTPFDITVTAQDSFGNRAFDFKGQTVHFSSSDPNAVLPADYIYTTGDDASKVFSFTLKTLGSQTITATSGTVSSAFTITVGTNGINKLSVSTPNLGFQALVGGTGGTQTLRLTAGPLTTNWRGSVTYATSSQDWLTLAPSHGTLNAANSVPIAVVANPKGLAVGSYTATLKLQDTANTSNAVSVVVTLNVVGQVAQTYSYYLPFVGNGANGFTSQVTLQNVGNGPATVTSQYFDQQGANIGLQADTCGGVAVGAACKPANPFGKGAAGTGVIVSNQPLAVIVAESTPFGGSAYAVTAGASANLVAPLAINNAGGFVTQLTVANVGAGTTTATVTFFDQHGNALPAATKNLALPAHASQTLDQTAAGSGLPVGFYGWARVDGAAGSQLVAQVLETRADIKFVALANAQSSRQSSVVSSQSNHNRNALTDNCLLITDNCLFAPAIFNNAFGGFVTGANIVNSNANPVTVTVTYYDSQGHAYPTTPFTLAAHALAPVYQGANGGDGLPQGGLPNGFYGSAMVSIDGAMSNSMVMVVNEAGSETANGAAQSGTYSALSTGGATQGVPAHNNIGLPVVANGGGGLVSGATLLNTGDAVVSGTILYYNRDGTGAGSAQTFHIAAHASLPVFQGAAGLPSGFVGQAIVGLDGAGGSVMVTTNVQSDSLFYTYTEGTAVSN